MGARTMTDQYFDGHTINLYFDDEHWLAHFVEMPEISAFSSTPETALQELRIAWEMVKTDYFEQGEPVPKASHFERKVA
jgi:predicted RNase H-like HicB family nuclease